ncbi:hypothetical protein [Leptospirillum ferriphilum]|uniref:hypothetical protein n=1 Tax=Leptospirillum ferriphilum TaxID=178606 RepID=UPI001C556BE4|nr:hypothetical protein [Leptospirillum ferriphilum]
MSSLFPTDPVVPVDRFHLTLLRVVRKLLPLTNPFECTIPFCARNSPPFHVRLFSLISRASPKGEIAMIPSGRGIPSSPGETTSLRTGDRSRLAE